MKNRLIIGLFILSLIIAFFVNLEFSYMANGNFLYHGYPLVYTETCIFKSGYACPNLRYPLNYTSFWLDYLFWFVIAWIVLYLIALMAEYLSKGRHKRRK